MGKLYPDQVITDVLDRCNIVELIGTYVPLKRAGRNFKACCPFHAEKTPSFMVSADKQIYHCFGCGAGGNALSFVMQHDRLGFLDALETLAKRSGIPLPEPERSPLQKERDDVSRSVIGVNTKAADFYHQQLMGSPEAAVARTYLQKRGIAKETAQRFKLGWAPEGWDTLIQDLKRQGSHLGTLEKSGLTVKKDQGGYYDRFRKRVVFPIVDVKDRVVAFGARVLDDTLPKYINSPETPVYTKGRHLFGLNVAREAIRQGDLAIVVEGYMDMIVPFAAGIENIVASLGTALTIDQIRLIKRFTNNVVMLYDMDPAGQEATLRALELLIEQEMNVRIARLPEGKDPDAYVRAAGVEALREAIEQAQPIFDYKLGVLKEKFGTSTVLGKERIVQGILPTIRKFTNATTQAEYVRRTSEALSLNESALWEDLRRIDLSNIQDTKGEPPSAAVQHYRLREIPVTERMLVKLMLEEMPLIGRLRSVIDPSDFVDEKLRKIVTFIFDFFCQGKTCKPHIMMNYLDDDEAINTIAELASLDVHDTDNREKLIEDCVRRLKRDKVIYQCQELQRQIQEVQVSGDANRLDPLIREYNFLLKQRS